MSEVLTFMNSEVTHPFVIRPFDLKDRVYAPRSHFSRSLIEVVCLEITLSRHFPLKRLD